MAEIWPNDTKGGRKGAEENLLKKFFILQQWKTHRDKDNIPFSFRIVASAELCIDVFVKLAELFPKLAELFPKLAELFWCTGRKQFGDLATPVRYSQHVIRCNFKPEEDNYYKHQRCQNVIGRLSLATGPTLSRNQNWFFGHQFMTICRLAF
jgi:hypothetical protein